MKTILGIIMMSLVVVTFVPSVTFAQGGLVQCDGLVGGGSVGRDCDFAAFVDTLSKLIEFAFQIATIIAIIVITYAGFLYLTAGDNSKNVSQAHQLLWYATIGFLIALSAWLIVEALLNSLNVDPQFKPTNFR